MSTRAVPGHGVFWRPACVAGVEVFEADETRHQHVIFHERYAICVMSDRSGSTVRYRGRDHDHPSRSAFLIEPGEVHVTPRIRGPVSLLVLFFEPALFLQVAAGLGFRGAPHWRAVIAEDAAVGEGAARVVHQLRSCGAEAGVVAIEGLLRNLLLRFADDAPVLRKHPPPRSVLRAREMLEDCAEALSLDQLAVSVGVNKFRLLRTFRDHFGLPPVAYQRLVRVEKARAMIARGVSGAHVSAECGFADQSHLVRVFRKVMGVTPGAYAKGSRVARADAVVQ